MKRISIVILFIFLSQEIFAQWTNEWVSPPIQTGVVSGWINFEKLGTEWNTRLYVLDTIAFTIMQNSYSFFPQYLYTFTEAEKLAGYQIYSLAVDLTGDNITEFYVLGFEGATSPYRQSFKILDITNNNIIFEKNNIAFSYSAPNIWDVDDDGILEVVFARYDYPSLVNYVLESYNTGVTSSVKTSTPIMRFQLEQNYPNPFNPTTTIEYELNRSDKIQLEIFNIRGEKVKTLVNEFQNAGSYRIQWDGTNSNGSKLSSGIYFYTIKSGGEVSTKKMILIK